ncbi:MAG: phosphoribosylformimino-5-aminoimidazole carboxamide ribonucleotide (ProFAR) isomerase [Candidatus Poriferisodalaceae bacterium]
MIEQLDVNVELSGGIDDDPSLERALTRGCARVLLGTAALEDPAWCTRVIAEHGDRVAVSIDVGVVKHPDGSTKHILAARGGTNLELYHALADATPAPLVASGGIATLDDLDALAGAAQAGSNLEGAVVGKALYAGRFSLSEALTAVAGPRATASP